MIILLDSEDDRVYICDNVLQATDIVKNILDKEGEVLEEDDDLNFFGFRLYADEDIEDTRTQQ